MSSMIIPNKTNSLFRTGLLTYDKFNCLALKEAEARMREQQKKLLDEINRRAGNGAYGV